MDWNRERMEFKAFKKGTTMNIIKEGEGQGIV